MAELRGIIEAKDEILRTIYCTNTVDGCKPPEDCPAEKADKALDISEEE